MFVAEVPALPGCISQGQTRKQALENIQEAISVYLESLNAHNEPVPPPIHEDHTIKHFQSLVRGKIFVEKTVKNISKASSEAKYL